MASCYIRNPSPLMKVLPPACLTACALLYGAGLRGWAAESVGTEGSAEVLEKLVGQLADERFADRRVATEKLIAAGAPALPFVLEAALGEDPERSARGLGILIAYWDTFDPELVKATLVALESEVERGRAGAGGLLEKVVHGGRGRSARYLTSLGLLVSETSREISRVRIGEDWKGEDKDLRHLLRFPEIKILNVSETGVGDEVMALLSGFPALEKLYLGKTRITAAGMAELRKARGVEYLSLQGLEIGNEAAAHVAPMTGLKHLGLDFTRMTDDALKHVEGLENLETLWLNGLEIRGPGLQHLEGLPGLSKLIFAKSPMGDAAMPYVGRLAQVRYLGLDDTKVTDAGISHLAGMKSLEKLWLNRTAVGDGAITALGRLTSLKHLYLGGSRVTPEGLKRLRELIPGCEVEME